MKDKLVKSWRVVFLVIVIAYIIVVTLFAFSITSIPKDYSKLQNNQVKQVKSELEHAIDLNQKAPLEILEEKYAIEFVVMNENKKVIFSTIPLSENFNFKKALNDKAVAYEEYYSYENDNDKYSVWLLQYFLSPQEVFDSWTLSMFITVASLITLNFIVIVVLFSKFVEPLQRLKDNVYKISKYQLDLINSDNKTEYDQITSQLVHFAHDLEDYIDNSTTEYTTLEKNLQIQNEKLDYKNKQVASMTHDLKGPINVITMQTDKLLKLTNDETIKDINESTIKLIDEINQISNIIYKNEYQDNTSNIELTKLILDVLDEFKEQLNEKKIDVELYLDILYFKGNEYKIRQIVRNAISNLSMYASENSEAEISCSLSDNKLYMSFYNENKPFSDEELQNIFKLFFRVAKDGQGTGTGLYTIKRLVEELNGEVRFVNKDKGVELQIELPILN